MSKRRWVPGALIVMMVAIVAAMSLIGGTTKAHATTPGFVTVMFGRNVGAVATNGSSCSQYLADADGDEVSPNGSDPDADTASDQTASDETRLQDSLTQLMHSTYNIPFVGELVNKYTASATVAGYTCGGDSNIYPNWAGVRGYHTNRNANYISESKDYLTQHLWDKSGTNVPPSTVTTTGTGTNGVVYWDSEENASDPNSVQTESCGAQTDFTAGSPLGNLAGTEYNALFAYPGGNWFSPWTAYVAGGPNVETNGAPPDAPAGWTGCYAMTRYYGDKYNTVTNTATNNATENNVIYGTAQTINGATDRTHYIAETLSISGGFCNDGASGACDAPAHEPGCGASCTGHAYMTPAMLNLGTGPATSGVTTWNNANGTGTVTCTSGTTCLFDGVPELSPFGTTPSGDWKALQFYKFVTGKQLTGTYTWDCSSANANDHWTSNTELYCFNDATTIMADLQGEVMAGTVQMVTPGFVADNWTGTDPVTGLNENLWHGVTPG